MTEFVRGIRQGNNALIARIAGIAALGGLLFGYDTGVISGALLYIKTDLSANNLAQQTIVALLLVGAIVGAMASGYFADRIGRKWTMFIAGLIYIVGAIGSALAQDVPQLVFARFILGLAVGAASFVGPLYISEVSPAKLRGGLVSFNQLAITVGIALSYLVNYWFKDMTHNWRWMLGIAALPGVALTLGMLTVPRSPRWLIEHGREAEGRRILTRLRDGDPESNVDQEINEIHSAVSAAQGTRLKMLLAPEIRPILAVGLGLAIFQQVVGINTVIYYAPTILAATGLSAGGAIGQTVFIGFTNVIFTIVAVLLIDKVGRRFFLIGGTIGVITALTMLGLYFQIGWLQTHASNMALFALLLYIASFAVGLGPVFWLVIAEIFPMRIRSVAMSTSTVGNWAANFAVSFTFLTLISAVTRSGAFFLYAGVGCVALAFFAIKVPETRNRSLEEIQRELLPASLAPAASGGVDVPISEQPALEFHTESTEDTGEHPTR